MPRTWIEIGTVKSVNPAKREIRVGAQQAHAHEFDGMVWLNLRLTDGTPLRCRVKGVRGGGEEFIVAFVPGVTKDNVGRMKKAAVVVADEDRKPRPEGQWHVSELPDLRVVTEDGENVGKVVEAIATGANDVIEVEKADGTTILLPVIEQLMREVDLEGGRIVIGDMTPYVVEDE